MRLLVVSRTKIARGEEGTAKYSQSARTFELSWGPQLSCSGYLIDWLVLLRHVNFSFIQANGLENTCLARKLRQMLTCYIDDPSYLMNFKISIGLRLSPVCWPLLPAFGRSWRNKPANVSEVLITFQSRHNQVDLLKIGAGGLQKTEWVTGTSALI